MKFIQQLSPKHWLLPVNLCLALFFVTQFAPENWQDFLAFSRSGLAGGDWWRLITPHFVHLSWQHLAMNSLVLVAFAGLYGSEQRLTLLLLLFLSLTVSAGLWFNNPGIERYVGFSGVLTGLMVVGAVMTFQKDKLVNLGVLLIILGKVVFEQWQKQEVITSAFAGIPTVVDAHLYGAVAGMIYCCLLKFYDHWKLNCSCS
ncbi:rhombosortase [Endozoicomonas sp. OPT23]|uniref:rhombosortase n=1 Tax=Endozoicomonas sp. OPT23 TaxID=2072845 RepID=UPI00129BB980|nr:rhombosortase [Endozoicomonas sp. OPT23]MRI31652.1 rhombosortase [Endozoicomonas sp. OPT23]